MNFAQLYDAHHRRHSEDLPFWLKLAARQAGPVLELGCGTGRVLLPIARASHRIIGLDNDPDMLVVLKNTLENEPLPNADILQSDLTSFHLGIDFSLILLPCNTFSTLSPLQRAAALSRVRSHLLPGGLFAASLPNPVIFKRLPRRSSPEIEEVFPHPQDGEPVQVSSGWERNEQYFTVYWHYDHLLPDGRVERISANASHYLEKAETYQREIAAAGLHIIDRLGDYDESAYHENSPQLILVASRSGGL